MSWPNGDGVGGCGGFEVHGKRNEKFMCNDPERAKKEDGII